jgi:hypothetical protein
MPQFFNDKDFIQINGAYVHFSLDEMQYMQKGRKEIVFEEYLVNLLPTLDKTELPSFQDKKIIVCLRNPLERAMSIYKFKVFRHKCSENFESFTETLEKKRFSRNTKSYCTINNQIPKNVEFINFNSLEGDLCKLFNINKIDVNSKKHNQIVSLNELQKQTFFKIKNVEKVISNINKWEEWSIKEGLLKPVTEKDFI